MAGGRLVDHVGPRSLAVAGSILGIGGYTSFIVAHSSIAALAAASGVLGFAWGLILTGIYPVVIRSASSDKTSVAVSINVLTRNTAVALGAQIAFAIIAAAGMAGEFPAETGFTRTFVMGLIGACITLLVSTAMPGRSRSYT